MRHETSPDATIRRIGSMDIVPKQLRLSAKISLLGAGSALITATALLLLAAWQSRQYNILSQREVDNVINADLDHTTQSVYNLVATENEAVQQQVDNGLHVARQVLTAAGKISLDKEIITWKAVNQYTNAPIEIRLPKLLIGGRWLGLNENLAIKTDVVDEVTHLVGESSTIFQRMNERGDMLRVATSVQTTDGRRAIGTYIPAIMPDGAKNPIIAAIMEGKTYRGRAFVVNDWYITAYEPLADKAGQFVGMLYVGFKQKNAEDRIRHAIIQTSAGKTGYAYVLEGKGEERGRYIVSHHGERDGENLWETRDSDGNAVIQSIIHMATGLKPGELATKRYRWQNPGEPAPRWKIVRLAYFEPWDWVIGASVYEDELQTYQSILSSGRTRVTMTMGIAGLAIALLIGLIGVIITRSITRPIREMTKAAETIIHGDLTQVVSTHSRDEIGMLADAFNFMIARLQSTMNGLRRTEEDYRSLFQNALEGIFQTSIGGQLLRCNAGFARMLGYDSPAEIETSITDIAHQLYVNPEDRKAILSAIMEKRSVLEQEVRFYRKDKQIIWVSLNASAVLDNSGNLIFIQGFITDITARRQAEIERAQLEEQLLQAHRMESIGRLAGGIAHDFNNMLQTILGNTSLALEEAPPKSALRESLEEIQKSAQHSADLTHQLLTFARKQTISPKVLDFNKTIAGMLMILHRLIGENIQLVWTPGRDIQPVKIDPNQVYQILANLTVNARDAIKGPGKVIIETSNITLDNAYAGRHPECQPGNYVMLAVSDTGQGMDEQVRARLFEPFFTTKELGKGTGLGLATVFGIMKQNNGFINVYSETGLGSTFKLYFPQAQPQVETSETDAPQMKQKVIGGTETILVVEDEEQILNLARRILMQHGYNVLAVNTPTAAIELAAKHQGAIHLLITDVVMPDMNGKQLKERLTANHPGLKCLFMSGYTSDVIAHHGVLEKGVEFLPKPFNIKALLAKVRQILEIA
jgi:PAS domain S-box-containing protein